MNSLFTPSASEEVLARIDKLQPTTQGQWGKMDSAQMLAHCANAMEMATGKLVIKRGFIGRFIGPRFRGMATSDKPFSRNSPTATELKMADPRDFAREKERLRQVVQEFHRGGEAKCTSLPHPFFGPLTPAEWSILAYKHLDHHLRQFGV
jgi:hypothetical protein